MMSLFYEVKAYVKSLFSFQIVLVSNNSIKKRNLDKNPTAKD